MNKEISRYAIVLDDVPLSAIIVYFKELSEIEFLPTPEPLPNALDFYGNPGMRYTVNSNGVTYTLRNASRPSDISEIRWSLEVRGVRGTEVRDKRLARTKVEVKFK